MAKLERGRLDGVWGMRQHTVEELRAWAGKLEAQINDPQNTDDPRWLRRRAGKLLRLADKKERARSHKQRQR